MQRCQYSSSHVRNPNLVSQCFDDSTNFALDLIENTSSTAGKVHHNDIDTFIDQYATYTHDGSQLVLDKLRSSIDAYCSGDSAERVCDRLDKRRCMCDKVCVCDDGVEDECGVDCRESKQIHHLEDDRFSQYDFKIFNALFEGLFGEDSKETHTNNDQKVENDDESPNEDIIMTIYNQIRSLRSTYQELTNQDDHVNQKDSKEYDVPELERCDRNQLEDKRGNPFRMTEDNAVLHLKPRD